MFIVIATDKKGNRGIYGPFHSYIKAKQWKETQQEKNPGFDIETATLFEPHYTLEQQS